jgi:membrane carboxypeptidase/penicillin-binding protein
VWLGYDNADGKRRTLGGGSTGGGVAVPIFEPVMQAAWAHVAPRTALAPPSPEAKRNLSCTSVDADHPYGQQISRGSERITECFRTDKRRGIVDTQYRLVSHSSAYARYEPAQPRATVITPQWGRRPAYVQPWQPSGWGGGYFWRGW